MYGQTTVMPLLNAPWEEITIDFITKLPKSKDSMTSMMYDLIIIVVNRLTKYTHFILFKETYDAE